MKKVTYILTRSSVPRTLLQDVQANPEVLQRRKRPLQTVQKHTNLLPLVNLSGNSVYRYVLIFEFATLSDHQGVHVSYARNERVEKVYKQCDVKVRDYANAQNVIRHTYEESFS